MKRAYPVLLLAFLLGAASCIFTKYYMFVAEPLSWDKACVHCRTNYVDLVSFQTKKDAIDIMSYTNMYEQAESWIGLSKQPGVFNFTQWSDGTQISDTHWKSGEPSYSNHYDCVATLTSGQWKTFNCSQRLTSFCYGWTPQIILVNELMTWEAALRYCQNNNTELVQMTTETDFMAVSSSLHNETTSVWIGLRFINGLWLWVNGKPLLSLATLPSCPAPPFQCAALEIATADVENRDCMEKRNFVCT